MAIGILVVDDEPDSVELMATGLCPGRFLCSGVFSGMDALDRARTERPDVVLFARIFHKVKHAFYE